MNMENKKMVRQTDEKTDRQMDRQTVQIDRWTDRQTGTNR
jgi:hypothetical protein